MKLPENYQSTLGLYDTQRAIGSIKRLFEVKLAAALKLKRVSAPLFVDPATGLNDNLSGVERPVAFDIPAANVDGEVVHSLAKWKRYALHRYDFYVGKGIITDMNAIRRDETLDCIHSIYVDQWDWEKVIDDTMRTDAYLEETVRLIVSAICSTLDELTWQFPQLETRLHRDIKFITSQELANMYPTLDAKQREHEIVREYKTVFIKQIGGALKNGKPHDLRAPDYDDWQLNGDLMFWHDQLQIPLEISSMGIRVNQASLLSQVQIANCEERLNLPFHQMILDDTLPLTIGGGIGQSRLCMLLLNKAHIGEVQSSIWDEDTIQSCKEAKITLL